MTYQAPSKPGLSEFQASGYYNSTYETQKEPFRFYKYLYKAPSRYSLTHYSTPHLSCDIIHCISRQVLGTWHLQDAVAQPRSIGIKGRVTRRVEVAPEGYSLD